LINQGYSYKVINKLGNLQEENLYYSKKEEQQELLQKVLAENESAADVEDMPSSSSNNLRPNSSSQIFRTQGTLSSLSGGDEGVYMEIKRQKEAASAAAGKSHHPLFKKFYYNKK
jgi:DNA excision repair protein ERCC-3